MDDNAPEFAGILGQYAGLQGPGGGILGGKYPLPAAADVAPAAVLGSPVGAGAPAAPATAPGGDLDALQRVLQGINAHAATLMALGGGTMTGGLGRGLQAAAAESNAEQKGNLAAANRDATVRALLAAGVAPTVALAAAGNPAVLRAVTARGFGQQPQTQTIKLRLAGGGEAAAEWDPGEGRYVQVPAPAEK
jgi:hypothetical protein